MKDNGDRFTDIYKEHYIKVLRLSLGYVGGDRHDAEDLAQEIFLKIYQNLKNFRGDAVVGTWVYRIAVNTCLLHLRSKKGRKSLPIREDQLETVTTNENTPDRDILYARMYTCIEKLDQRKKAMVLLTLEGLPQKEIADIMGIIHQATRVSIHRIKEELTKCTKENEGI